jgi:hypothetical protein
VSIKVPIVATVDTAGATSSIDSLIKKLQNLQNLASKSASFPAGSTQALVNAVEAPRKIPGKKERVLNAAKSSTELTKLLSSTSSEIQKLTVGEAEAALEATKKVIASSSTDSTLKNTFKAIQEELERLIKTKVGAAADAIRVNLADKGNLAKLVESQGTGRTATEILELISRIDKSVVGSIGGLISKVEKAAASGNTKAAETALENLLKAVDGNIANYIQAEQARIRNALFKTSGKSAGALSEAVNRGNAGEVSSQLRGIMEGSAGDLSTKQLKGLQNTATTLLASLPVEDTDAAITELKATLIQTLTTISTRLGSTADKVEEVKVEAVSAESKVEAAAESAGADVKKAVEKIAEVVEDAGEKALADVTAAAPKPGKAPKKTAQELADEAYERTLARGTGRDRANADLKAARMASGGGGGGRGGRGGGGSGGGGGGEGPSLKSAIGLAAQEMQRAISIIKDVKGLDTIDDLVQLNRGVVLETNKFFDVVKREFAKAIDAIDEGKGDIAQSILFDSMLKDAALVSPLRGQQRAFTEAGLADQKIAELKAAGITLDPEQEQRVRRDYLQALAAAAAAYRNMSDATRNYNAKEFEERRSQGEALAREGRFDEARATVRDVDVARPVLAADPNDITAEAMRAKAKLTGDRDTDSAVLVALGATDKDAKDGVQNIRRIEQEIGKALNLKRQKSPLERLASFGGKVSSAFGFLQMTIGQSVVYLQDLLEEANKLEKTSATVSALAGDFAKYTKVMGIAAAQQQKFGGSLEEQLSGFSSLVPITKRYNVDLAQLDNVARRLAIVDPLQGFQGASIALKEFFSGDITSLSRRFEIDRTTLNGIKAAGDQVAQLQELDRVLAGLGISNAVLEARANTSAAAFDRFGGAISNVKALAGQGLQNAFAGAVDKIAQDLEFAGEAIAENLQLDEQANQVVKDVSKLASEYDGLRVAYGNWADTQDGGKAFIESSGAFETLTQSIQGTTLSMSYLVKETNVAIDRLNEVRMARGEAPIQRYSGSSDYSTVALGTQAINLGIIDPQKLYGSRSDMGGYTPDFKDLLSRDLIAIFNDVAKSQVETIEDSYATMGNRTPVGSEATVNGQIIAEAFRDFFGFGTGAFAQRKREEQASKALGLTVDEYEKLVGTVELTTEKFLVVNSASEALAKIFDKTADSETRANNERRAKLFIGSNSKAKGIQDATPGLSDLDTLQQYFSSEFADAFKLEDSTKKAEKLLQIVQQIFDLLRINTNLALPIAEQVDKATKSYNDASYAAERLNKYIEQRNSLEKTFGDNLLSTTAYQYQYAKEASDGITANRIAEAKVTKELVSENNELGLTVKAQLSLIADTQRMQAKYTMEADRSVDAVTALSSLLNPGGKIRLGMEEIVDLAMQMRQTFSNISLNTLLPTASIQDQFNFQLSRMRGGTNISEAYGPRNMQEAEGIFSATVGLYQQMQQDAGSGSKTGEELLKLEKDYNKDRKKAQDDHDKDMYELNEKYLKDLLELQRKSELTKRATPLNFYKNMQGLENLTPEQRQAYAARFEEGRTEAGKLRAEGKFTAAEEVMQGTADLVFNEASNQNEILQNQKDITEAEKDLGKLKKELAAEGDAAKRQEIQDKITLKNEEIARYNNNIANINSLKQLQFDSDNEVIVQARLKEETITKDYETELDNRKKAHDEKLADMKTKYDENVGEKMKADNKQRDNFLANAEIMSKFTDATLARNRLATGIIEGLPMNRIDALYQEMYDTQNESIESLPEGLRESARLFYQSLSDLKPNMSQTGIELAETPMTEHTEAMIDMVAVLKTHSKSLDDFTQLWKGQFKDVPPWIRIDLESKGVIPYP